MTARIIDTTTFDLTSFAEELRSAPGNLDVGTRLWLENDAIRVWEVRLKPGERCPFHTANISPAAACATSVRCGCSCS